MKAYSYSEIGMLVGAAIGGALATGGFVISNDPLFFTLAAIGIAAGVILGNAIDRKHMRKHDREVQIGRASWRERVYI